MTWLDESRCRADLRIMFNEIYHGRVLELAANIPHAQRLEAPDGSARQVSRICGSVITADVKLDEEGRVTELGLDPRACVLGQATLAVAAGVAIGKTLEDFVEARAAMRAMLKQRAEPPKGDFWELRHFEGVSEYPMRHPSVLLGFDAIIAAIKDALDKRAGASQDAPKTD